MGRPRKNTTTKNMASKSKANQKPKSVQDSNVVEINSKSQLSNSEKRRIHIVQRGESIQSIAGQYSVPVMKLIMLNGSDVVTVGQRLYLD